VFFFTSFLSFTLALSMTSGALYHLVATYSVRQPVWSYSGSAILKKQTTNQAIVNYEKLPKNGEL